MKIFKDRKEAGLLLGKMLEKYKSSNPIVIAIPRGGVETGYYVALKLGSELEVIIARKLGYPEHPELAFGAVAEDGSLYLNPWVPQKLTQDIIEKVKKSEIKEIESRIARYRNGRPLPDLKGRTVIIVDDGIATGSTLFASIEMCKKQKPGKIVVAVPVAGHDMTDKLHKKVDDVVILTMPEPFFAVSQVYEQFDSVEDREVILFLNKSRAVKNINENLPMSI